MLLCLAGVVTAMSAQALQSGITTATSTTPPSSDITAPTYLEKSASDPVAMAKQQGWQMSGLSTRFGLGQGDTALNFSGGYYSSRDLTPSALFGTGTKNSMGFSMLSTPGASGSPQGLFFSHSPDSKEDQAYFQHLDYQGGGLNFSGSYSSIGKNFQGFADLTKQVNPADAGLLGLGLSQTNMAMSYTGLKGIKLASTRSTVGNSLAGNAENGLTRTKQTNSLGFAFGKRQSLDFSVADLTEEWDPTVLKLGTKQSQIQTLKWAGAFGQRSQFSLGQTLTDTTVGKSRTEDFRQHDFSLKLNEWKSFGLNAGFMTKDNGLNGETDNTLNLDLNAAFSPRLQFTGKVANSSIAFNGNPKKTVNDLLDLRLTSSLSPTLQLVSGYHDTDVTGVGMARTHEQRLTWTPSSRWKSVSHFISTSNSLVDDTALMEQTITGQLGAKARPSVLNLYASRNVLSGTINQDRSEITYTHPLGAGADPAKILVQVGSYRRAESQTQYADDMVAAQVLNIRPLARTTLSAGYYDGPYLGAGYLNYRTWGQKNAGNLAVWGAPDFNAYREVGGELGYKLTGTSKLILREMQGHLQGTGTMETMEYGLEQHIGRALLQVSQLQTTLPGKDGAAIEHETMLYKLVVPGAKPLPDWAANSMHFTVFQDAATWGFVALPTWMPAAAPTSGLTLEKREAPDALGKIYDQNTMQLAGMLTKKLCILLSDENHPYVAGTTQADMVRRRYVHLGYFVQPKLQLFTRYIDEDRKDTITEQQTLSFGIIGQLSAISRLQLQMDSIVRSVTGKSLTGEALPLEYDHSVNPNNTLSLKWRLNPAEFFAAKDRTQVEASYRRVF